MSANYQRKEAALKMPPPWALGDAQKRSPSGRQSATVGCGTQPSTLGLRGSRCRGVRRPALRLSGAGLRV
jgi:hypothetical protein